MKTLIGLTILVMAVPVFGANMLSNGSFENGFTDWTTTGGPTNHEAGWFWNAPPSDGSFAAGAASNWGRTGCTLSQTVAASGDMDLSLSWTGWTFDNSNDWGWDSYVKVDLLVDGVQVDTNTISSMVEPMEQQINRSLNWSGPVVSSITVNVGLVGNGMGGGGWGVASTDNYVLIPEPATLGLLLLGGLPLVRRRRVR